MKASAKSFGSRIIGAAQDVTRSTGSALSRAAALPGLSEVQGVANRVIDGFEILEGYRHRCQVLSKRIDSIMKVLEPHQQSEIASELHYFYDKLKTCQKQLSRADPKRGLSRTLLAARQLEVIERLEKELDSSLQDMMLALLIQKLSQPRETVVQLLPPQPLESKPPQDRMCYYKIKRHKLDVNDVIHRTKVTTKGGLLSKSIARGTYRNRKVLVVQYSSKSAPREANEAFLAAIKGVILEQHPNVLRFLGASEEEHDCEHYCMVFDIGTMVSRHSYLYALRSAEGAFRFLTGVKRGMEFLLEHGIETWADIHVSETGQPVVSPPYWDNTDMWEKSNYDVFSSLTGTTGPTDFPLGTLSEILNIACDRWPEFESKVTSTSTKLRDYHLMQIAEELELAIPPFLLVYSGPLPDFIISIGSVGIPDWFGAGFPEDCFQGSMTAWTALTSLWTCTGWEALQTYQLEYWTSGRRNIAWGEDIGGPLASMGALPSPNLGVLDPLSSSSGGWLSYGCFESSESFGVAYELTISSIPLFERSWNRFSEARVAQVVHHVSEEQEIHGVRHISVRIHCKPGKLRSFLPLYFHRRPCSMFNPEHYWGFLSDSPDPEILPCELVKNIQVDYRIDINTMRVNDGWKYRAEQCFAAVISRTPGSFNF